MYTLFYGRTSNEHNQTEENIHHRSKEVEAAYKQIKSKQNERHQVLLKDIRSNMNKGKIRLNDINQ